jgi:C-terminal processing protease CtpA/Prc
LVADGDDFSLVLIDDVEVDSPAAKAGIEGGDIITAIDGRSTVEVTLDQIRKLFMQEGREYQLSLKRGAKVIQTKLKLRKSI